MACVIGADITIVAIRGGIAFRYHVIVTSIVLITDVSGVRVEIIAVCICYAASRNHGVTANSGAAVAVAAGADVAVIASIDHATGHRVRANIRHALVDGVEVSVAAFAIVVAAVGNIGVAANAGEDVAGIGSACVAVAAIVVAVAASLNRDVAACTGFNVARIDGADFVIVATADALLRHIRALIGHAFVGSAAVVVIAVAIVGTATFDS